MRAAIALIFVLNAAPALAQTCSWVDSDVPVLRVWDRMVVFQRQFRCPADAAGPVTVRMYPSWYQARSRKKTVEVRARGKWDRTLRLSERLFANDYCPKELETDDPGVLVGSPGEERVMVNVPVEAVVEGEGPLKRLAWKGRIDAKCPKCSRRSGYLCFRDGRANASRLTLKTRIEGKVSAEWFECVKATSILTLRIFADNDRRALRSAIRPVLQTDGLHRKFRRSKDGKAYIFSEPAPYKELCKKLGTGAKTNLMWELSGRGELHQLNGGGRSSLSIQCGSSG